MNVSFHWNGEFFDKHPENKGLAGIPGMRGVDGREMLCGLEANKYSRVLYLLTLDGIATGKMPSI